MELPDRFITRYPDVIRKYAATVTRTRRTRIFRRLLIRYPLLVYVLLAFCAAGATFVLQRATAPSMDTSKFVNATTYVAAIGLLIGAYQAWLNSKNNQAVVIKDFLSKFFEKDEFYSIWYDLFYIYPNMKFQHIEDFIRKEERKTFEDLWIFNKDRETGKRFWHPDVLLGSEEEARIDRLLGAMNILGDYYDRGNLSLSEIGDAAEYYLLCIGNSEAFRSYIDSNARGFATPVRYKNGEGPSAPQVRYGYPPFRHLCVLLSDLDDRRRRREKKIYAVLDYGDVGKHL